MEILTFPLGQLRANCYFLIENKNLIIIDPADEADFILEEILRRNLKPHALLATHGHFDHLMAAGEIQLSFDIPLYIFKEDLFLVKRLNQTAKHFLNYVLNIISPKKIEFLKKEKLQVTSFELQVIPTPGHTPGGCCFYFKENNTLFTGDTLFKDSVGRYDFSYASKIDLFESIKNILKLPEETIIYPGHGDISTIGEEKVNFKDL